ncbi:MAG TPA: DUF3291 domain-containing protein [Ktedonobacteraceae bacterium]
MYSLAQGNIARTLAPLEDPRMTDFVAQLDTVNALADTSPGFIWRLQTSEGNATAVKAYDDPLIIFNMSVWATLNDYSSYVYSNESLHREVMKQRRRWFQRFDGPYTALWWIPQGHIPTVEEAKERLEYLRIYGETAYAFSIKKQFPAPDASIQLLTQIPEACPT